LPHHLIFASANRYDSSAIPILKSYHIMSFPIDYDPFLKV